MNIKEVISQRKSIRTYKEEPISQELKLKLENYISTVEAPFNTKIRFTLLDLSDNGSHMKLGTYGVIKGAKTFISAATEQAERYEENLGYAFEKIILYATSLNVGTCWLGGSFNRPQFAKAAGLKKNEIIPVISPVGYAKENRSLIDSIIAKSAGSNNRKDWSELFFDKDFDKPLKKEEAEIFEDAFDMVRIAPSALNKQPWRIIKDGSSFHFFLCRTTGYKIALGFDIQRLDIGIAMCHFEAMVNELGLTGKWADNSPSLVLDKNVEYIVSYIIDNGL